MRADTTREDGRFWPWALRQLLYTLIGAGAIFWSLLRGLLGGH